MKVFQNKLGGGKLRIIYLFAAVSVIAGFGGYGYHLYSLFRDLQINKPQPQVEKLIRDLRLYHTQTRHFPQSFIEINQLIWHTRPVPDYGGNGRQSRTKNYYYFYTKVSDETCAFWALPIGPRRDYASSFFIVVSPSWLRVWKGRALSDAQITHLPPIPPIEALSQFGLQELPDIKHY